MREGFLSHIYVIQEDDLVGMYKLKIKRTEFLHEQ